MIRNRASKIYAAPWNELPRATRSRIDSLFSPEARAAAQFCLEKRVRRMLDAGLEEAPWVMTMQIRRWVAFLSEFVGRLEKFLQEQGVTRIPLPVADLGFDLSELHNGGRSVVRVSLTNGTTWYYKPRSGRHEEAWGKLLQQLTRAGFSLGFHVPTLVSGRAHCWMAEVKHAVCRNRPEMKHCYFRAGAILYLAHMLRAVDLHAGNFIIHGEHPVLIDCETFFHPVVPLPPQAPDLADSILRTGMLPISAGGKRDDVTFLGRRALGTHAIYLHQMRVALRDGWKPLRAGFEEMDAVYSRARDCPPMQDAIARMRALRVRCVPRPTRDYVRLLEESWAFARSHPARRYFLQSQLGDYRCSRALQRSELRQLLNGDVPIFHRAAARPRTELTRRQRAEALAMMKAKCVAQQPA